MLGKMTVWDTSCHMLTGMMSALRQHCTNMHADKAKLVLLQCKYATMHSCIIVSD